MAQIRVLTVCTGNICRSPMAEVVLRARLATAGLGSRVEVDSAGISGEERGNPIDVRAQRALRARGYPVPRRSARQVTPADVSGHDLVLAMTADHARSLRRIAGSDAAADIRMMRSFDRAAPRDVPDRELDIDDPWYGGARDFEVALDQIEAAADGVVAHVRAVLTGS